MMTLDGTFWVEDGVPYMVFCNEWVQVSDGTVEYMPLKDDLSDAAGPPKRMFRGSSAKWSELIEAGGHVTDGPYVWKGKTGKLYVIWSSRAHDQTIQIGRRHFRFRQTGRPVAAAGQADLQGQRRSRHDFTIPSTAS